VRPLGRHQPEQHPGRDDPCQQETHRGRAPLRTIAVFTAVDRRAMFVREADEAVLIDTAALCRIAGLEVVGLHAAAVGAASDLTNPRAAQLCDELEVSDARRTFLHWEA